MSYLLRKNVSGLSQNTKFLLSIPTIVPPVVISYPLPSGFTLTATPVLSSQINLTWTIPNSDTPLTYSAFRSLSSIFTPNTGNIIVSGLSTNSYSDTNLTFNTTYYYYVSAINLVGGTLSNEANALTFDAPPYNYTLSVAAISTNTVTLSWTIPNAITL